VSKWGTYYPKSYATWIKDAAAMLDELNVRGIEPWTCPVFVMVTIGAKRPKKPANPYPVPDVDNYAKANLDAMQKCGYLIKDDKQVQVLLTSKRYVTGDEVPYSAMYIADSMDGLANILLLEDTEPGDDVYDLPEFMRTPLHMLEEE
jgi:Holliday junction resolvase RusA-like endonuclease